MELEWGWMEPYGWVGSERWKEPEELEEVWVEPEQWEEGWVEPEWWEVGLEVWEEG